MNLLLFQYSKDSLQLERAIKIHNIRGQANWAGISCGLNTVIPKLLIPQLTKETQRFHPKKRRLINRFWDSLLRAL